MAPNGNFAFRPLQKMKDYYAILGIPASASDSDIKSAFRKLAVRYHPDKNPTPEARALFYDLNEAYDVLGDPKKRAVYDNRRANPFREILSEPPPHRDPAYHRQRRHHRPPGPAEPPASYLLMRDSLKYVLWISRAGLLICMLFFIDYFLPYQQETEIISNVAAYTTYRGGFSHLRVSTASGRQIKLYDYAAAQLQPGDPIRLSATYIFDTVMWVTALSGTYREWIAYLYSTLIFIPVLLCINSSLALIFRKNVEFCFSLNITAGVLLIITLILL